MVFSATCRVTSGSIFLILSLSQLFCLSHCTTAAWAGEILAENLISANKVLLIAHRGNSSEAPENTLPAFQSAVDLGVDLVELDYYHSSDGVPVVFHDKDLDRTTDASRLWHIKKVPVESKTFASLRKLDAGNWFSKRFAGTVIPTLNESLDVIQPGSMTLVERKGGSSEKIVQILESKKLSRRVVVQSFDWKFIAQCHKLDTDLVLGCLGSDELTDKKLDEIVRTGAKVVGWNHEDLTPDAIRRIHDRSLKVWAWTVDDIEKARQLVSAGIDGIITNVPRRLKPIIQ